MAQFPHKKTASSGEPAVFDLRVRFYLRAE